MKALLALLVLLTAWPCDGQVRRRVLGPRPSAGGFPLPSGIQYRWIATNLFDPVTNWVDTVSGSWWIQNTAANQPHYTNGLGVFFNGALSEYLNATNIVFNSSNALLCVFSPKLITLTRPIVASVATPAFGIDTSKFYTPSGTFGTPEVQKVYDVFISPNVPGKPIFEGSSFTNGVICSTSKSVDGSSVTLAGKFSTTYFTGYIYEVIIWSNAVNFTTTEVSAIHSYSTNRWSYSP